jgi:hypothetical protein
MLSQFWRPVMRATGASGGSPAVEREVGQPPMSRRRIGGGQDKQPRRPTRPEGCFYGD